MPQQTTFNALAEVPSLTSKCVERLRVCLEEASSHQKPLRKGWLGERDYRKQAKRDAFRGMISNRKLARSGFPVRSKVHYFRLNEEVRMLREHRQETTEHMQLTEDLQLTLIPNVSFITMQCNTWMVWRLQRTSSFSHLEGQWHRDP